LRIHRIYAAQALEPETELVIGGNSAHYLARVLRVTAGQPLVLFNGDGHDYAAEVIRSGKNDLHIKVLSRLPSRTESFLQITLVQAISRGERMDLTLQKCTELGVAAFQPLVTERVEVRIRPDKLPKRMEHWRQVVVSACEQSGRSVIPAVNEPILLHEWLGQSGADQRLVLDPEAKTPLPQCKLEHEVEILIGPEGGFSDTELAQIKRSGVVAVSLGPRVLRTETAGPAAVSVLQALFGDFG
jgi:16S rRNA (uracil1498-N3)-methyltransferase